MKETSSGKRENKVQKEKKDASKNVHLSQNVCAVLMTVAPENLLALLLDTPEGAINNMLMCVCYLWWVLCVTPWPAAPQTR